MQVLCDLRPIVDNVAPGNRKVVAMLTKNRLFASTSVSSSYEDVEHAILALIDQTRPDPTRRAQRVQAIRPIPLPTPAPDTKHIPVSPRFPIVFRQSSTSRDATI